MADDIRKGLGIRRRKPAGSDGSADSEGGGQSAEGGDEPRRRPAPSKSSSSGPLLGIRRRTGPQAAAATIEPGAEASASAEATAEAAVEAPGEQAPARSKGLGSDQTAVLLANHFKLRPQLRERLPERLFELQRTHGRYIGDGRPERKLEVGFKPAVVLYTIPPWGYDEPPKYGKEGIVETGLHRQPTFSETSFTVDEAFNKLGDMYIYVAFQDDGQPLDIEERSKHKRRSSESGRSSGPSLGIKRRK